MAPRKTLAYKLRHWTILAIPFDHFSTIGGYDTGKPSLKHYVWQIGMPVAIATLFQGLGLKYDPSFMSILATALSIFAALLFSVLLILLDQVDKSVASKDGPTSEQYRRDMVSMLYRNVCYAIFISTAALVLLILRSLVDAQFEKGEIKPVSILWVYRSLDTLLVASVLSFILTIQMILQRTYLLFRRPVDERAA